MFQAARARKQRVEQLKRHLKAENPLLVDIVAQYEALDAIARRLGLHAAGDSYTGCISWWPLISVLGTFSSGKSSFINERLGVAVQRTGNQAVDDRFTVLTYAADGAERLLPGIALSADPRFPFYRISERIGQLAEAEGIRVNNFLQLKTVPSELLRDLILIDSPGFDADVQRATVLRLSDHIIDLSDLVLVFFDARRPEPGAMQDTLTHLVDGIEQRHDSEKFLFVLNQIDTAAREDNLEEVVAAWQRTLAQHGMASQRFYCVYSEQAAVAIEEPAARVRFEGRRARDLAAVLEKIESVRPARTYRIVSALQDAALRIEARWIPALQRALRRWSRWVLVVDALIIAALCALLFVSGLVAVDWPGMSLRIAGLSPVNLRSTTGYVVLGVVLAIIAVVHFSSRYVVARAVAARLTDVSEANESLRRAFLKNTRFWHSVFRNAPVGWTRRTKKKLAAIRERCTAFITTLNDRYAVPQAGNGASAPHVPAEGEPAQSVTPSVRDTAEL
ncbi:MAG: dynamin family protein [Gammaproteobacteria bacterium]